MNNPTLTQEVEAHRKELIFENVALKDLLKQARHSYPVLDVIARVPQAKIWADKVDAILYKEQPHD